MGQAGDDIPGMAGGSLLDAAFIGTIGALDGDGSFVDDDGIVMAIRGRLGKGVTSGMAGEGDTPYKLAVLRDFGIDPVGFLLGQA